MISTAIGREFVKGLVRNSGLVAGASRCTLSGEPSKPLLRARVLRQPDCTKHIHVAGMLVTSPSKATKRTRQAKTPVWHLVTSLRVASETPRRAHPTYIIPIIDLLCAFDGAVELDPIKYKLVRLPPERIPLCLRDSDDFERR
jgi:hypothetical protein